MNVFELILKCFIFHNIFKFLVFQRHSVVLVWSNKLKRCEQYNGSLTIKRSTMVSASIIITHLQWYCAEQRPITNTWQRTAPPFVIGLCAEPSKMYYPYFWTKLNDVAIHWNSLCFQNFEVSQFSKSLVFTHSILLKSLWFNYLNI